VNTAPPAYESKKVLYIATSADGRTAVDGLRKSQGLVFSHDEWPAETHATIYHPAALKAFRAVLKP
jgi:hypothetical protein